MSGTAKQNYLIDPQTVRIRRDDDGFVQLHRDGQAEPVAGVMSLFPLTRPQGMVSLRAPGGAEIGIIEDVRGLDAQSRHIVEEELERSYFMPVITDILGLDEQLSVVEWDVQTNKGPRVFHVRSVRRNVRKMGSRRLIIKDVDGNRYEIPDWMDLPIGAQRLIEPYL